MQFTHVVPLGLEHLGWFGKAGGRANFGRREDDQLCTRYGRGWRFCRQGGGIFVAATWGYFMSRVLQFELMENLVGKSTSCQIFWSIQVSNAVSVLELAVLDLEGWWIKNLMRTNCAATTTTTTRKIDILAALAGYFCVCEKFVFIP